METQMPRPGPQHEDLAKLAGDWIGEETMFPSPWSPQERKCTGTIHARVLDGFFVISDYEQKAGDEVTFRGHGVYSWDPGAGHYLMYWFDSMGGAGGVAYGQLEGNQLTFQNTSPMGHHRYRYTFEKGEGGEKGTNVFEMSISQDGNEWHTLMVGRYKPAS